MYAVLKIYKGDWSNGMTEVSKTFSGSSILSSPAGNRRRTAVFYVTENSKKKEGKQMLNEKLILRMASFNKGDPKRIQHFIKVYEYAHMIGKLEGLDEKTQKILDLAAILHDIGIRPSEEKYGRCDGKFQEQEGPVYAKEMLREFPEITKEETDRICYLIGHHHTYTGIDGEDYRILLEADFLVNAYEDAMSKDNICAFRNHVFRTKTGIELLDTMFGITILSPE